MSHNPRRPRLHSTPRRGYGETLITQSFRDNLKVRGSHSLSWKPVELKHPQGRPDLSKPFQDWLSNTHQRLKVPAAPGRRPLVSEAARGAPWHVSRGRKSPTHSWIFGNQFTSICCVHLVPSANTPPQEYYKSVTVTLQSYWNYNMCIFLLKA